MDVEGNHLDANPSFERLSGYKIGELAGVSRDRISPPESENRRVQFIEKYWLDIQSVNQWRFIIKMAL